MSLKLDEKNLKTWTHEIAMTKFYFKSNSIHEVWRQQSHLLFQIIVYF